MKDNNFCHLSILNMNKFIIVKDVHKRLRRFGVQGRTLEFKLKPVPVGENSIDWTRSAIQEIVKLGISDAMPDDQIGFTFSSKDFSRGQGWSNFKTASKVTFEDIWELISGIYQSNSTSLNTETFSLGVTIVTLPIGSKRGKNYNTFEEECDKRRGIISVYNEDNLCLPRALIIAMAHVNKDENLETICRDTELQTTKVNDLMNAVIIDIPEEGAGIPEIQIFQRYHQDYQIVVYQYGSKGRDVIFKGAESNKKLNLIYHQGHYNVLTSLTSAFCCRYYCEICNVPYNNKNGHRCTLSCPACQQTPTCSGKQQGIACDDCKRSFRGQNCYENHKRVGSSGKSTVCNSIKQCELCLKIIPTNRTHACGERFCKICNQQQPQPHYCYFQINKGKLSKDFLFIFYDLETRQEKRLEEGTLLHEPNLCVFQQRCSECMKYSKYVEHCDKCGIRKQIIKCDDPISTFVHHILNIVKKKFKNIVVLAHNGGGFDHQFILNYILTKTDLKPELIMRGTKLISLTVDNVKFLDSLNYFPMALSKLPKSFGFTEFKKGYFPHLFNCKENQHYVGPVPELKYYDPDNLAGETREKLIEWHKTKMEENYEFDFQKEIVEYCISDVDILTEACLSFRELMLQKTSVCPFLEGCTIASVCNKVFRRKFLKPNTIGIIPKNRYRCIDIQSEIALKWLIWEGHSRGIRIKHAANGREAIVAGRKVDGFCDQQVFEFHGCYFHGCRECYKYQRDSKCKDDASQTLDTRYESTIAKTKLLRSKGYEVIEMWECRFRRMIKENEEILNYVESHPLILNPPLNPRDAFYGGRTGNTKTYHKCEAGEKIKYLDVCSLYPFICKYGKFPVGHPKVIVDQQELTRMDLTTTSGLIKCKILPPHELFHPVLPQKMNNKLMFVLCRECGENMNSSECGHSDEERTLSGTWVIEEVVKAIQMGYEIQEIHEIWSYETVQFGKDSAGLFADMMNKFIKIKQESSDWPKNCSTNEEKQNYIDRFAERENVKLEFNKICNNPGLRSLSKLMLNSFWGKFGQRENQPKTIIINTPDEFFHYMTLASVNVNTILPINEETLVVTYQEIEEVFDPLPTVNVSIAAYVTSQARLKLYSYLEKLGDAALYYDTDSVIFISRGGGEWEPPTGEFIGDMTDELEAYGPGSFITEFVSGGPKNYAYVVYSPSEKESFVTCKVKGISQTYAACQVVNFESIKEMVLNPEAEPLLIDQKQFGRTKEHEVVTKSIVKKYKPNSLKRNFHLDGTSYPYGYKQRKID